VLSFAVNSGSLECTLESRLPNLPSGTETQDLAGGSYSSELRITNENGNTVSGEGWTDFIYQEQMNRFGPMIEQAGLAMDTRTSWSLTRQP
jgi:hypothetical protein